MRRTADSYENIVNKSNEILDSLDKLGVWPKPKQCRYHFYIKLLTEANIARRNGGVSEFLKTNNPNGHFWFILKQVYELTTILGVVIEVLIEEKDENIKTELISRVRKTLSGPNYPKDETTKNSSARNIQFELLVFSKLLRAGYEDVKCLLNPDILLGVNSRKYPIECKRVIGKADKALIDALNKGINQINTNWKEDYFNGIIALDLSAIYEQGNNYLECGSYISGDAFVQYHLEKVFGFLYNNCPKLKKAAIEGKIIGTLLNVSAVYILKDKSDMGWINEIALGVMNKENPQQAPHFISDFQALKLTKLGL